VVTLAEHTRAIQSVYRDAMQDLLSNQTGRGADRLEIDFLHSALLSHGFARTG
jgi:hypothetical protein